MKPRILIYFSVLLTGVMLFYGCQDHQARFDDPPWLGGTNIETLEKAGKYTQFLALMDKAEYRISIENQMFTLFVPSDSSFEAYYKSRGINSVEDLSVDEAEELFGQHILVNPRSRDQLMYEYAWNELQTPTGEYGTLFFRKKTYSVPLDYIETNIPYNPTFIGQSLKLYRTNTFVPLFTTEFFEDYFGATDGSDYLIMYPDSKWSGTQWNDAMVLNQESRTSSGFIYYIDRVVAPMPTIDKYMLDNPDKYGVFFDIAQRFATYGNPLTNEFHERTYRKSYNEILNIADERGPSGGNSDANQQLYNNMLSVFTVFTPSNEVLQDFLDNTVLKEYPSIDSVPKLFLVYLLKSHINNFLCLPSKMEKRFVNYLGDNIQIDLNSDIATSHMCSNGIIYTMNRVLEPNVFTCVPGPLFYNKEHTTSLYALDISGELSSVSQPDNDVTLFATSNDALEANGIRGNEIDEEMTIEIHVPSTNKWKTMDAIKLQEMVRDYYHFGKVDDLSGEGFIKMASDNFVYYNNNKIYGGGNQVSGNFATVLNKIESDKNGNLFYLDRAIEWPNTAAQILFSDPELSAFTSLMTQAGLIDSVQIVHEEPGFKYPRVLFMPSLTEWTVLAPTNEAIAQAEADGLIPTEIEALRNFIYYHFVRNKAVFDDGNFSGSLSTHCIDNISGSEIVYKTVTFTNALHSLSVSDIAGNHVAISHSDANHLVETGVLHKINHVLISNP